MGENLVRKGIGKKKNWGDLNDPSAKILWSPQLSYLRLRQKQLGLWDWNGPSTTWCAHHEGLKESCASNSCCNNFPDSTLCDTTPQTAAWDAGRLQTLLVNSPNVYVKYWFSNLSMCQNDLEILINHALLGSTPQSYQFSESGVSRKICISNFSGVADAVGLESKLRTKLSLF